MHQVDMDSFVSKHSDEVTNLLRSQPLGNWLTRKRRFHVIARWVAEELLNGVSGWEWVHWDAVHKESTTHHICLPTPEGTNARMRVMINVWNKAADAWKYALMQLGINVPEDNDAGRGAPTDPWQPKATDSHSKYKKYREAAFGKYPRSSYQRDEAT